MFDDFSFNNHLNEGNFFFSNYTPCQRKCCISRPQYLPFHLAYATLRQIRSAWYVKTRRKKSSPFIWTGFTILNRNTHSCFQVQFVKVFLNWSSSERFIFSMKIDLDDGCNVQYVIRTVLQPARKRFFTLLSNENFIFYCTTLFRYQILLCHRSSAVKDIPSFGIEFLAGWTVLFSPNFFFVAMKNFNVISQKSLTFFRYI